MKRLLVVLLGVFFLAGCGAAARESGFYENNTMYKSYSHLKFSVYGHKQVDPKEVELTKKQNWWGVTIWGSR
jgi:hypothetical protein